MRSLVPPLALALAALPLAAQEVRPALPLVPNRPVTAPQDPAATPKAGTYEALQKEFEAAQQAWMAGYSKAYEAGEEAAGKYLRETARPEAAFVARFQGGANDNARADAAIPYLVWLARNDYAHAPDYLKTLLDDHVESAAFLPAVSLLSALARGGDASAAIAAFDRVIERSPHQAVRLQAIYGRAQARAGGDDAARALAREDFRTVIDGEDARLAERARGALFELEHLQIGMTAPDVAGEDVDGVAFELSDYRGKVVVLDFWGDW